MPWALTLDTDENLAINALAKKNIGHIIVLRNGVTGSSDGYSEAANFLSDALLFYEGNKMHGVAEQIFPIYQTANNKILLFHAAAPPDLFQDIPGNENFATLSLDKAQEKCDEDSNQACYVLALMAKNSILPNGSDNFLELLKKSCNLGNLLGCYDYGMHFYKKSDLVEDHSLALLYFDKSCELEHPEGCYWSAMLHSNGVGTVKGDNALALSLFEKSCAGGKSESCFWAGILISDEKIGPINLERARLLHGRACASYLLTACNEIFKMYRDGTGVTKNAEIADYYYNKSCVPGERRFCLPEHQ